MTKSIEEILAIVKAHPAKKVKLGVIDINGILRGKTVRLDKFESTLNSGFGFCDVIFSWDLHDEDCEGIQQTGWHTGYPDAQAQIDSTTFRQVPWDNDIPFFLADFRDKSGSGLSICPRSILKKVREKADNLGYQAQFAQEFEWFNFRENSESLHDKAFKNPKPITNGMFGYSLLRTAQNQAFYNAIFDQMEAFKVPLEGLHTETGPGTYEAAILYGDVLESADRAVLFKSGLKEIAHRFDIMPTFMAKWSEMLPGCSGHLHQSLWRDGDNVFHSQVAGEPLSKTMQHYIAGLLYCLPELLPMYAPTVNSYKRLVEGAWAPTTLTWGVDNRTVAVRALPGGVSSSRLELRVPGSDVNPYLAMAAALASGLYGIEHELTLDIPQTVGNGYQDNTTHALPTNLEESAGRMANSELARNLFGGEFVDYFVATRLSEHKKYTKAVTDWELKRYFEII